MCLSFNSQQGPTLYSLSAPYKLHLPDRRYGPFGKLLRTAHHRPTVQIFQANLLCLIWTGHRVGPVTYGLRPLWLWRFTLS